MWILLLSFHMLYPFPEVKLVDFLKQSATDLVTLLKQPPSTICPSLEAGDPTYNAITKLATLLNRKDVFPSTSDFDDDQTVKTSNTSSTKSTIPPTVSLPRVEGSSNVKSTVTSSLQQKHLSPPVSVYFRG